jgi:hypothetical protein
MHLCGSIVVERPRSIDRIPLRLILILAVGSRSCDSVADQGILDLSRQPSIGRLAWHTDSR